MGLGEEVWIFYTIMSVLFKLHYQYIHCIYNKTFHVYKQRYERAVVETVGNHGSVQNLRGFLVIWREAADDLQISREDKF